ncbi:hypothetical protein GCM10009733_082640 [Nonomuraea maheshkhaliensis]|uniref:Tachylectin 2 domain-containing protein n=1 Tax=Nonomuraea maheshkhaliensis TaxID=419590 RepID=A0ABN2GKW0_9ACTN
MFAALLLATDGRAAVATTANAFCRSSHVYWHDPSGTSLSRYGVSGSAIQTGAWLDGARQFVGEWAPVDFFTGGDGVVYAIDQVSGDLWWYSIGADGKVDHATRVGTGWNKFAEVFAAEAGVIYGRRGNGDLLWFMHEGYWDGSASWANGGVGRKVGSGFADVVSFPQMFSAGEGSIYTIDSYTGDMLWWRHDGWLNGTASWANGGRPKKVGTGWGPNYGLSRPAGMGGGHIYVSADGGRLLWFRHDGYRDGSSHWANNGYAKQVGSGFDGTVMGDPHACAGS